MKHIAKILAFIISAVTASAHEGKLSIATVELMPIAQTCDLTLSYQKSLDEDRALIKKDNKERLETIKSYDRSIRKLTKQIKNPLQTSEKKRELYDERKRLKDIRFALNRERLEVLERRNLALAEKSKQMLIALVQVLRETVDDYAEEHGYEYVVDISDVETELWPELLHSKNGKKLTKHLREHVSSDGVDVSSKLLEILNSEY